MNRVDTALGYDDIYWGDDLDADWIARHGRNLRKRKRENRDHALRYQSTPIATRYRGWRRYGAARGIPFSGWSPWMGDRQYKRQIQLAVGRGARFVERTIEGRAA